MLLRVVGCHGGETPRHRTTAFVVDDVLAIDAGSLTSGLDLPAQYRLRACLIGHAHLDHIRDLATISDNRCQKGCPPLVVAATRGTLRALKKYFFNGVLWPDFTQIPSAASPTIQLLELKRGVPTTVAGFEVTAIPVTHTIESSGFLIARGRAALGFTGDTGPTDRFWEVMAAEPRLRGLLAEVSFPNRLQRLATDSGHHTPRSLGADLRKSPSPGALPTLLYHMKPAYLAEIERECARLRLPNLSTLRLDEELVL